VTSSSTPENVLRTFCAEVAQGNAVWTVWTDQGVALFSSAEGGQVVPFWSTQERCANFIVSRTDLESCSPVQIPWHQFRQVWAASTAPTGADLGINWAGSEQDCLATREEVVAGVESAT
jgi:hypothetical protein